MALRRKRRKLSTQFHSSHSIFTNPLSRFQVQVHTDHSQLHDTKHRIIKYVTICTKCNKRFPRVIPVLEFAILVSWTIPAEIDSDRQSLSSSCLLRARQLTRHAKVVPGRQRPLASFARNVEYENVSVSRCFSRYSRINWTREKLSKAIVTLLRKAIETTEHL